MYCVLVDFYAIMDVCANWVRIALSAVCHVGLGESSGAVKGVGFDLDPTPRRM